MSRVAIVTGGTRGIGEAISLALKEMGMTVVANYAGNEEKAKAFTDRTGIKSYKWDVGNHQACLDGCAQVVSDVGPIDVVVNNAGITRDGVLAKMSFDDWNDEELQQSIGQGRRVIPNAGLAFRDPEKIGSASGQNIQDANLIRIRITHGYAPLTGLRFIGLIYTRYLQWLDSGGDDFRTALIAAGRIPVVTHATLLMQSEAIEPDNPISTPGPGNHGTPVDPGDPPVTTGPPPECGTAGCTTQTGTLDPGGGNEGGCTGDNCPVCGSPDSSG